MAERGNNNIEEIYNRHVNTIYRLCFVFMKNQADTEDAVQNTFIKLIISNIVFNNPDHEKAWLINTASNHCKNSLKYWFRSKRNNYEDYIHLLQSEDSYDFELLDELLSLPDKYKTVIYLYYYEGYSTVEISDLLNIKEGTVRSQLSRARKLLRKNLGGDYYEK